MHPFAALAVLHMQLYCLLGAGMTRTSAALQNHADLPIVLILGMSTSAQALGQILPISTTDLLSPRNFQMVRSLPRLEAIFRQVLLSDDCRLFFGHALLRDLDDYYMRDNFTIGGFQKGLHVGLRIRILTCLSSSCASTRRCDSWFWPRVCLLLLISFVFYGLLFDALRQCS